MKGLTIGAALAALLMPVAAAPGAFAANAGSTPVLLVDRQVVMNTSKLGENIRQQIMGYEQKAQSELGPEGQALQNEDQAAGAKKSPALQAKEAAFRQKVQERQSLIQGGEIEARKFYLAQVDTVVHAIMATRGAQVVLEKNAAVDSVNGLDITADVIRQLDKKTTTFKVPLVKPPLSDQLHMLNQQQQQ